MATNGIFAEEPTDRIFVQAPTEGIIVEEPTKKAQKTETVKYAKTVVVTFTAEPPDPKVFNLTAVWTPPCNSVFHVTDAKTTSCLPPDASLEWITDDGYYSPGICFSGYTSGCSAEHTGTKRGQTAAMCVPSDGFARDPEDDTQTDVPAFEIRWEEGDLSLLETHPQTPEAITTSEPTGEATTDGDSRPAETSGASVEGEETQEDDDSGFGGFSRGAVAGIAVGVALAVILLCAAAFLLYRRLYLKPPPTPPKYAFDSEKNGSGTLRPNAPQGIIVWGNYPAHTPGMPKTPLAELCAETTNIQRKYARDTTGVFFPASGLEGYTGVARELRYNNSHERAGIGVERVPGVLERDLPTPVDYLTTTRSNVLSFEIKRKPVGGARGPG